MRMMPQFPSSILRIWAGPQTNASSKNTIKIIIKRNVKNNPCFKLKLKRKRKKKLRSKSLEKTPLISRGLTTNSRNTRRITPVLIKYLTQQFQKVWTFQMFQAMTSSVISKTRELVAHVL
jgi:hypothetical protein